jgi:hypothetical protein
VILRSRALDGWSLFSMIVIPISVTVGISMTKLVL